MWITFICNYLLWYKLCGIYRQLNDVIFVHPKKGKKMGAGEESEPSRPAERLYEKHTW